MIRTISGRQAAIGSEGLVLLGIVTGGSAGRASGVQSVALRDLVALVERAPAKRVDATSPAIAAYRAIVEEAFRDRAIVPAPFGTVFRSREALVRWMELHYVTLSEGLAWVHDRAAARLVMAASPETATADYESAVFESTRFLKRHAVACVTHPDDSDGRPRTAELSFLVERERWSAFADAVRDEQERLAGVTIEQSGPWPAYDFVRLNFGT